jgi:hypothetical protein
MSEQRKKKLKALKRVQKEAARVYREQRDLAHAPASFAGSSEPVAVDRFLRAYGELTDATVELYKRLDREDPRHEQVRDALAHARQAAASALDELETESEAAVEGELDGDPAAYYLAASGSVELVRTARPEPPPLDLSPSQNLPAVVRRGPKGLPNESFVVRYVRVRRATHRWPDEASLARYLRERPLPDESSLRRYLRRRRELYRLYG